MADVPAGSLALTGQPPAVSVTKYALVHRWYPLVDTSLASRAIGEFVSINYRFSVDGTDEDRSRHYYDSSGILQAAATDAIRFDHHPTTLEKRGYLKERYTRNYATNSEDLSQANWVASNTTKEGGTATAPNNASTAYEIREDSTVSTDHYIEEAVVGSDADLTVTASAFVKRASGSRNVFIRVARVGGASDYFEAFFDLDEAVADSISAGGTGTVVRGVVEELQNGWYRIGVTGIASTTTASTTFRIGLTGGVDQLEESYDGDGTSGLYIWGLQTEEFALMSGYVYNDGTNSQRWNEEILINGKSGDDFSWFIANQGVYYLEYEVPEGIPHDAQKTLLYHDSNEVGVDYMIYAQSNSAPNESLVANTVNDGNEKLFDTNREFPEAGGVVRFGWGFDGTYNSNAGRQFSYTNGTGTFPSGNWSGVGKLDKDDGFVYNILALATRQQNSLDPEQVWIRDFRFYQVGSLTSAELPPFVKSLTMDEFSSLPPAGSLTLTGQAPALTEDILIPIPAGALMFLGYQPGHGGGGEMEEGGLNLATVLTNGSLAVNLTAPVV